MANYSIRDLEKLSGIKAHTLRIWEKRYNLVDPKRTNTNIRFYNDEDLKMILNIALLNRNGIKISRIAAFNKEEICNKISELTSNIDDTSSQIENLIISMIELDEKKFDKIINSGIQRHGFEKTLQYTIYPFFEKAGVLWQTGAINPAQEHFVSNLVKLKLSSLIAGLPNVENSGSSCFLLFLPEGELHEISLLFYYYLIKKHGHKVIYLGQSVPFEDLSLVQKIKSCDYLFTSFSSNLNGLNINNYILKLAGTFRNQNILFSSFDFTSIRKRFPGNVTRIMHPAHLLSILKSL